MWTRRSLVRFLCCFLVVEFYVGTSIVHAESKSMARPTRLEMIAEPEELKQYLAVRDYYTNQRPRYGKRGDINPTFELNATWEILKMIVDAQRQNQLRRQEKTRQDRKQILFRDSQNSDGITHMSHIATRPGYLLDVIDKYYDDIK